LVSIGPKIKAVEKRLQKEYPWDKALTRIITWIYSQWGSIDKRLNANNTLKKNKGKAPAVSQGSVSNKEVTAVLVIGCLDADNLDCSTRRGRSSWRC
jgi:hypothetical protein